MASTGVNVLRYTVFGSGILYGFYHQAKLGAAERLAAVDREYARKQDLIEKARSEFTKKNLPASAKTGDGDIIRDPENPNFDLEALLNSLAAESK